MCSAFTDVKSFNYCWKLMRPFSIIIGPGVIWKFLLPKEIKPPFYVVSLAWLCPWTTCWTWRRLPGSKTFSSTPCSGSSRSSKVIPSILAPTDQRKMDYPILATADQIRRIARKVDSTCSGYSRSSKLIPDILTPAYVERLFTVFCLQQIK